MPTLFLTKAQKHTMEKRQPLQQMLLGKVVIFLQKTETSTNSEVSTGKSREYSGSNRYKQRLPQ
jgi:hypothetical protein